MILQIIEMGWRKTWG